VCDGSVEASAIETTVREKLNNAFFNEFVGSVCRVLAEPFDPRNFQVIQGRRWPREPPTFLFSALRESLH
jgi:hypothetical protein